MTIAEFGIAVRSLLLDARNTRDEALLSRYMQLMDQHVAFTAEHKAFMTYAANLDKQIKSALKSVKQPSIKDKFDHSTERINSGIQNLHRILSSC